MKKLEQEYEVIVTYHVKTNKCLEALSRCVELSPFDPVSVRVDPLNDDEDYDD